MTDPSPITNRWLDVTPIPIAVEHFTIFRGRLGEAYSHHPQIVANAGRLIASWSLGIRNEDDPGQKMVMAVSDDFGETWSRPWRVADKRPGIYADAVITAEGIRIYGRNLVAYYGVYEYLAEALVPHSHPPTQLPGGKGDWIIGNPQSFGEHTEIIVSDDCGLNWSDPVSEIDRFIPNLKPSQLESGRWIIPGDIAFPYSDDPAGVKSWTFTGIPDLPEDYRDAPGRFQLEARRRGSPIAYCEGSFFQTDDGVIHMMLRTDSERGRLAVTESRDDGATWSEPVLTDYTDCQCRFEFGRLPDGRFFGLSCPEPGSPRTPLVLATSDDGVVFDRHYILGDEPATRLRIPGDHKGGRYGYPSLAIAEDTAFVIYSINKEDVAVGRFPLRALT
ncbi:MAG: sialidase family protein [Anaerolineae bacterium]